MAISGGDGSIILTTKVDTSGMEKGTASLKSQAAKLASEYRKAGMTQSEAFKKAWSEIERTKTSTDKATQSTKTYGEKAKTAFQGVGSALKSLAGYLAIAFSVTKIIQFSNEAGQFATQTEASVQRLVDIYGESAQSVGDFIDANAKAIGMSKASASSFASVYGNLFSVWADQNTNAELTNRYLNMTAVVASKTGRTVQDVQERIRSGLLGNTEAIEDLGVFVNVKTIEMTEAFQRMANGKSWEQLDAYTQQQVRTMAILEQATSKYGNTVADTTATTRAQYQAAYEDFKNTWGQVVNTVLIPVLKVLTQVFTIATKGLQIIAGLTGNTIDTSTAFSTQEEAIGGAVDNQNELTDAVKGTNKELKKSLAGFDEINILSQDTAESGDAGQTGTSGGFGGIGDIGGNYDSSFVDQISGNMVAIMGVVGGALVAVGLLLIFSGSIGWGIGFIIAGASVFSVAMATLSSSDQVSPINEQLMTILGIAGIALTAIGLILLFSGSFLWGIAFIVAGASALSVTIVALKEGKVSKDVEKMLTNIMMLAGGAILALGVILLLFGVNIPLAIGLVVAGGGALVGAIALNPQLVQETISNFFADNAGLIVGISLALLVIGIVLCVCGIVTPLSIGMIVVGATGIITEIALNWNYITEKVTQFFQDNAGLIVGVSIALIVLGIILLFTGVGIPLAIGLIVAGGGALAATVALNWNFIVDKVKEVWQKIKDFWNNNIAPIFTLKWWKELGINCINGLIAGFEGGINGIISAFESLINFIVKGINKLSFTVPDWVPEIGGEKFGFNLKEVNFKEVKIPRLAKGAVIPPNREFLAVLGDQKHGTNIEAPLQTIVDAFNIALQGNANSGGGNTEVVLEIDGRELGRVNADLAKRENRIRGTRLVLV